MKRHACFSSERPPAVPKATAGTWQVPTAFGTLQLTMMEKDGSGDTIAEYSSEPDEFGKSISQRYNGQRIDLAPTGGRTT